MSRTSTVRIDILGLLSLNVPIDPDALMGLIEKLDRLSDERKNELRAMGVRFSMDLDAFDTLCRDNLQRLKKPVILASVQAALNLLRGLARQSESISSSRITEIDTTGDGLGDSKLSQVRIFTAVLGIPHRDFAIRCPN